MTRGWITALFATAAVAVGLYVADGSADARVDLPLAGSEASEPLLAFRYDTVTSYLVRVDPLTLRPLGSEQLDLRGSSAGWSFSPDRSRLVLGDTHGHVDIVDTRELRLLSELRTSSDAPLAASAWIGDRVLAGWRTRKGVLVRVIDPDARRVLRSTAVGGFLEAVARTSETLALLLGPARGIGSSRLVLLRADGSVRSVGLSRIRSGLVQPRGIHELARHATPGLAVDPDAGRAYVVGAGAPVAEVDLDTLGVSYHALAEPVSLLQRASAWLVPAAEAKSAPDGPNRSAMWIGNGVLAVFGSDDHGSLDRAGRPQLRVTPAGVRLVNTRTWTVSTLDAGATSLARADGVLLATASLWDFASRRTAGIGLAGYGEDASLRFHLFGEEPIFVQAVGTRAFVRLQGPDHRYLIVDLAAGAVVDEVAGEPPLILARGPSSWIT